MKIYDLLIVGAGPAGLGAGIQSAHMGLTHAVIEGKKPQSRLLLARKVENFPLIGGGGRPGPELYRSLIVQSRKNGANIIAGAVSSIFCDNGVFVIAAGKNPYKARAVILATGMLPKKLGRGTAPQELEGKKIFYRWTDVPGGKRKGKVLVIGGGETAFDQACSLAEKGFDVTVAVRGKKDRAFASLRREARTLGVSISYNTRVVRINETKEGLLASVKSSGQLSKMQYDCCLAAIGGRRSLPELSPAARARLNRGLWLAGDAADPRWRQAAIAFGDGIKKAMMAGEYLREKRG